MREPIANTAEAVRELGALPVPVGSQPLSCERLGEIEARANAAYPGPWNWRGNTEARHLRLQSPFHGGMTVMDFVRYGMNGAQPRFAIDGIMHKAEELVEYEVAAWSKDIYRKDVSGIAHPDAVFIAHAREDVPALVAEVRRLSDRVAELEAERHVTNEALDDAVQALRARQVERETLVERMRAGQQWQRGRNPELVSENYVSQSELRGIFGIPLIAPWDEPAELFVPQTERSRWVAIAAALNAAHDAGMPVGIDLDGTLTDHRMWSVVWDRAAERWTVAGYEDDDSADVARDPIELRWGLDDVFWNDDNTVTVLLSDADGQPYHVELEPSQAAVLQVLLSGPDGLKAYRPSHDSIPMGLYLTAAEARKHCEDEERRSWPTGTTLGFDWIEDEEDGVAELVVSAGQNEESVTGYIVTVLEVSAAYDREADA